MTLTFTKMHGLGNDFMVLEGTPESLQLTPAMIQAWADRNTGIGFDQLLVLSPNDTDEAPLRYWIYNADGHAVEQCGNGARCLARYAFDHNLIKTRTFALRAPSTLVHASLLDNADVKVDLGTYHPTHETYSERNYTLGTETVTAHAVQLANPHVVMFVETVDAIDLPAWGAFFNNHPDFKNGVNVEFCEQIEPNKIKIRVFERGVGETQACGTGACAAMIAGHITDRLPDNAWVQLPGGTLHIQWSPDVPTVYMTGPATTVYTGTLSK